WSSDVCSSDLERGLSAELEGYLLQRRGGIGHDGLAGTDLAGERDLADAGMTRQEPPGLRPALRHLEYPLGQSRSRKHLLKLDGRERSEFGGLEDHGVAARERRSGFPAGDLQRVVPGADAGDHPERLAARVAEGLWPQIDVLAGDCRSQPGVIFQALRTREHIDRARLLDRLAGVAGLEHGEFLVALAQHARRALQHAPALRPTQGGPLLLRRLRLEDCGIDLRRTVGAQL